MNKTVARRDFLKILGAGTTYLAVSSPLWGLNACQPKPVVGDFYKNFVHPPSQSKPFYRWWWNGDRVTKEEVARELEVMHSAGAGGVEINPIALNPAIKNPTGKALQWLSKEWIEVLQASIEKGKELGMISDMIIGTGWPFGGKFLKDDETIQGLDIFTEKVRGPATYIFDEKNLKESAEIKEALLLPIPVTGLQVVQNVTKQIQYGKVKIPPGHFEISVISWRNKFREVMHGAPGGDGPVLDHFNKTAVEKYLQRTYDGLKPTFGENLGKYIRSMFCDSIELSGANWTGDFRQQFQERNGYDVWEYLPLILNNKTEAEGDFSDTLQRVRYDYYSTLSELFTERFIITFNDWCHKVGVKSRYQAYGHPWILTDLLDGNMIPDIPEGDQWLFNGGWTATQIDQIRYAIWDKYTSSAAHLRGLKIASCEAMTNTSGVFSASLEYIKQATDINVVAGINHLVLHGWNYSPPEAGFPGWIRYGTYFSQQNPWFPYLHLWSEYAARLNFIFQHSQAVSQVAIIGPTADRWSESGLDRNPFLNDPWYLHSLWQAMNHHGYCSDYLNQRVFQEAIYENGEIKYGPMSYKALIICDMQTAFPEFIDALSKYAQTGGKIIFVGRTPFKSPGMRYKNDNTVAQKTQQLLKNFSEKVIVSEEPEKNNIVEWAGDLLQFQDIKPGVKISVPDERLYLYQAEHEGKPVFFFSNQNRDKSIAFDAEFETENLYPWKWNAETGDKTMYSYNQKNVGIHLKPLESLLLVFSEEKEDIEKIPQPVATRRQNISENWQATFTTPEGETFKRDVPTLGDIARMPGLESFSGTIVYRKLFETDRGQTKLDLGKVAETAEVTLNGQNLGVKWWGEKTFDISKALETGDNELEIKVTTLLWNYCDSKTMEQNPMAKLWAKNNRDKSNKPLPTGLIGPVTIS